MVGSVDASTGGSNVCQPPYFPRVGEVVVIMTFVPGFPLMASLISVNAISTISSHTASAGMGFAVKVVPPLCDVQRQEQDVVTDLHHIHFGSCLSSSIGHSTFFWEHASARIFPSSRMQSHQVRKFASRGRRAERLFGTPSMSTRTSSNSAFR